MLHYDHDVDQYPLILFLLKAQHFPSFKKNKKGQSMPSGIKELHEGRKIMDVSNYSAKGSWGPQKIMKARGD